MANERLLLVTTVPPDHLDALLAAMTTAGAGVLGAYSECAFVCAGQGRFRAGELSNPAYGERGALNTVEEVRVETWVERDNARAVVTALRTAHPYEEPVIYLVPLLDEAEL
jgi:hypothetical protein